MRLIRLVIPMLIAIPLAACESEDPGQARGGWGGTAKVVTQRVELQHVVDEIEALGTARANESVQIQPRISSLVEKIYFEEGQLVDECTVVPVSSRNV